MDREDKEIGGFEWHHMAEWDFTEGHCQRVDALKPPEPWLWSMLLLPRTAEEEKKKKIPSVFVSHCGCCCCCCCCWCHWPSICQALAMPRSRVPGSPLTLRLSPLSPIPQYIRPSICPLPPPRRVSTVCLPSLSANTSLHPPLCWSPQKRLIQEGWAVVSELSLLCPMRRFHSTFLPLRCFYGPDTLTDRVAPSQPYPARKGILFGFACLPLEVTSDSINSFVVIHFWGVFFGGGGEAQS